MFRLSFLYLLRKRKAVLHIYFIKLLMRFHENVKNLTKSTQTCLFQIWIQKKPPDVVIPADEKRLSENCLLCE
ncbi:hypothetical protein P343_15730 [Sporolactobacillus laevolacticus DSM 442]|uniref:Uncharacterized protein n=1 Tax=Sporolactobacillus laevolacticus DSM 442 TaxID=1395513 RepID=V6IUF7_9BACL|nr:hypothetical protein P343_15730 [Sporolactobacillus laevolacticus DSM 442]